jgi:DNA-binding LacI/PurR family transcriptional regulator
MCFNNVFPASFIFPALTAIDIPGKLMGQTCAKLLLEAMQSGKAPAKRQHVRIPESLIVRESTGPAPKTK